MPETYLDRWAIIYFTDFLVVGQFESSSQVNTPYAKKQKIPTKMMQAHQGLHGIGNNHTNSHQAQFGRLRLPFFSDSIQFTFVRLESMRNRIPPGFQTNALPTFSQVWSQSAILLPTDVLI
jgi:hypothetical protein